MTELRIAAIVEGDGEVEAVPILIRRHARLMALPWEIKINPIRQPASKLFKEGELERIVELAARKIGRRGGILVLLDCEDDCPAELGPKLLARVQKARPDIPSSVVLAHREFEAWFLGAAASLAGKRSLPQPIEPPPAPESIRNCKKWFSDRMPRGRAYNECDDQPAFAELFDMEAAKLSCDSFDKFHREITSLLQKVAAAMQ